MLECHLAWPAANWLFCVFGSTIIIKNLLPTVHNTGLELDRVVSTSKGQSQPSLSTGYGNYWVFSHVIQSFLTIPNRKTSF